MTPAVDIFSTSSSDHRLLAWSIFIDAVGQRPFFGYGWNQTVLAQMAVATEHPHLHGVFVYSHNFFLDLVLWCGIPLGLSVSIFLLGWFWKRLCAVKTAEDAVFVIFLLVVANHAMLELPLYYAYLLLPVGLVMGALDTRLGARPVVMTGRLLGIGLWCVATTLLALLIRDYARVESSYQTLRLEWSHFKMTLPVAPPKVVLLTQWHDYIKFARMEPKAGLSTEELEWMRGLTGLYPGGVFFHKLATVLALNHQPDEAKLWLQRMCKVVPADDCTSVKTVWARQSIQYPEIAAIPWPVTTSD